MEGMLGAGIELATLGMGTVFLFLTLLILMTSLMSRLVLLFEPEDAPQSDLSDPRLVAVIAAAVQQFRSDQKRRGLVR